VAGSKPKGSPRRTATPVDAVFSARSIAVVGASRDPRSIGHTIVRNLVRDGFRGTVYPVNPRADHILSIRAKLEPNPAEPRHLLTVHGVGYRFVTDP